MNDSVQNADKAAIFAKYVLIFLSVLLVLISAAMVGISAYASFNDKKLEFDFNVIAFFVALAFGAVIKVAGLKLSIKKPTIKIGLSDEENKKDEQ